MKKVWIWLKKNWGIILGIVLLFSGCFIIYKQTELQISDKIQAWCILTLVFITGFYAVQTQKLVEQQKNFLNEELIRRSIEFREKRFRELYSPLGTLTAELSRALEHEPNSVGKIESLISETINLVYKYYYMLSSDATTKLIMEMVNFLKEHEYEKILGSEMFDKWKEEVLQKIENAMKKVHLDLAHFMADIKFCFLSGETLEKFYIKEKKT